MFGHSVLTPPMAMRHNAGTTLLVLHVENGRHVDMAFGSGSALLLLEGVRRAALAIVGPDSDLVLRPDGGLQIGLRTQAGPGQTARTSMALDQLADLIQRLSRQVLAVGGQKLLPFLSGYVMASGVLLEPGDEPFSRQVRFSGLSPRGDAGWARQYRHDMASCAATVEVLLEEGLPWSWRPARSLNGLDAFRFHYLEASLDVDPVGQPRSVIDLASLDRAGASRVVDVEGVLKAIAHLEQVGHDTVAVQVAAASATPDLLWREIGRRLADRRDIARRLVIEIRGGAQGIDVGEVAAFATAMTRLGCIIGVGNFGLIPDCCTLSAAIRPGLIRIDSLFARRAMAREEDARTLASLIHSARALADDVVVDGVDSESLALFAQRESANWAIGRQAGERRRGILPGNGHRPCALASPDQSLAMLR